MSEIFCRLLLVSALFLFCPLYGVVETSKHEQNKQILRAILQEEISSGNQTPEALSSRIAEIGKELVKRGFDSSAYGYRSFAFDLVPLWEGKTIPLTFFICIWPPEKISLQHKSNRYASNIHGHPIPCALTVLERSIVQISYQTRGKIAYPFIEEILHPGDEAIDDQTTPFVHKIVCRENGSKPAITLHAYGAPTAKKVMAIFEQTFNQNSYTPASHDQSHSSSRK